MRVLIRDFVSVQSPGLGTASGALGDEVAVNSGATRWRDTGQRTWDSAVKAESLADGGVKEWELLQVGIGKVFTNLGDFFLDLLLERGAGEDDPDEVSQGVGGCAGTGKDQGSGFGANVHVVEGAVLLGTFVDDGGHKVVGFSERFGIVDSLGSVSENVCRGVEGFLQWLGRYALENGAQPWELCTNTVTDQSGFENANVLCFLQVTRSACVKSK